MGQRRGQAKQEGITVFVRVRASGAQDEGDSPQVDIVYSRNYMYHMNKDIVHNLQQHCTRITEAFVESAWWGLSSH